MKYTIFGADQKKAVEYQIKINDIIILKWAQEIFSLSSAKRHIQNDDVYYWLKYENLISDYPVLQLTNYKSVKKRLTNLSKKGFLEYIVLTTKREGRRSFWKPTAKMDSLFSCRDTTVTDDAIPTVTNGSMTTVTNGAMTTVTNGAVLYKDTLSSNTLSSNTLSSRSDDEFLQKEGKEKYLSILDDKARVQFKNHSIEYLKYYWDIMSSKIENGTLIVKTTKKSLYYGFLKADKENFYTTEKEKADREASRELIKRQKEVALQKEKAMIQEQKERESLQKTVFEARSSEIQQDYIHTAFNKYKKEYPHVVRSGIITKDNPAILLNAYEACYNDFKGVL